MGEDPIAAAVAARIPGARVLEVTALDPDAAVAGDTHKVAGYGVPRRIRLATPAGERSVVFHIQRADGFGHDRRADRAAAQVGVWDDVRKIPRHARALDVGAVDERGGLISLAGAGEFYVVTEYVPGTVYADDLRRIGETGATPADHARCEALARYLVQLHAERRDDARAWTRSIRDLVGSGEGILGMIDGYPEGTPAAPRHRLRELERLAVDWRWKLRDRGHRLATIHGDFHPFNVVFGEGTSFHLLDASRGCAGDPADDVTAMAINYVFFAGCRPLWDRFFAVYLAESGDDELLDVLAPYLAWRALVVASPAFYPALHPAARDRLLQFAERALAAPRFSPAWAEELFP